MHGSRLWDEVRRKVDVFFDADVGLETTFHGPGSKLPGCSNCPVSGSQWQSVSLRQQDLELTSHVKSAHIGDMVRGRSFKCLFYFGAV